MDERYPTHGTGDSTCVIVCEPSPAWMPVLRRDLPERFFPLFRQTRRLDECELLLAECPAGFLLLHVDLKTVPDAICFLTWLGRTYPAARAVVVGERRLAPFVWLLREAGAAHVVLSPRRSGEFVRMIERHLARCPAPRRSLREKIWSELPWPTRATTPN